jgi:hypothetical protein
MTSKGGKGGGGEMFLKEVEIKSPITAHILSEVLDLLVALQYLGPSENFYCMHNTQIIIQQYISNMIKILIS